MSTAVLIPVEEYLAHTTDPDCEYVDGLIVERAVGQIAHSDAQGRTYAYALTSYPGFWPGVETRVQVRAERFRVPDVVIVRGARPAGRIITQPPEVAVEVLSPDDRASDLQDKLDDYFAFGIATVWVLNPQNQRAWIHTADGSREAKDGILRNVAGDLQIPLSAIFPPAE